MLQHSNKSLFCYLSGRLCLDSATLLKSLSVSLFHLTRGTTVTLFCDKHSWLRLTRLSPPTVYSVTQRLLPEEPRSRRLMTSDQDTKVVAEPQVQQVQEAKENAHLVSLHTRRRLAAFIYLNSDVETAHVFNFSCLFQELWVIFCSLLEWKESSFHNLWKVIDFYVWVMSRLTENLLLFIWLYDINQNTFLCACLHRFLGGWRCQ